MQGADYIIVGVLAFSVVLGGVRGFVREIAALVSWIVGLWLAWRFSGFLLPYLGGALATPSQKAWAARVIVLLGVLIVGHLVGGVLAWITHTAAGLGLVDRLLGAVFGFCRGVVIVGFLVLVGRALDLEREPWWLHASLTPHAEAVGRWLDTVTGGYGSIRHRFDLPALPGEH